MSSTDSKIYRLDFKPGINRQSTRYAERGGWYDSDKVRFRQGRPENMRGWQKKLATQFQGTSRALTSWTDLQSNELASFGTECKLYIYKQGSFTDITPIRQTDTLTSVLNTSVGSPLITVSAPGHGMMTGDSVLFVNMAATIGGNVLLSGEYTAVSIPNSNVFIVSYASNAAATSANAGLVTAQYLLNCGSSVAYPGLGYGVVAYGFGGYGVPASSTNFTVNMRQWALDQWGEDLIANPRGGRIYVWNASAGVGQRAQVISASPTQNNFVIVSPEDRHLISLGGTDVVTSIYDPLLIQWSDQENYTVMTPTVTNTAGSQRLGVGNRIVGGARGKNMIHIWTEYTMHAMTFTGPPFTFSFRQLGTECGLIGPHARVNFAGRLYWMSNDNFYMYDGQVTDMKCSVLKYVFDDINLTQKDKVYCGTNSEFSEIIWLYCSANSDEIDRYVIYDIMENAWAIGTLTWTSWQDKGIFDTIIATNTDSRLYDVEPPDVYTADGQPMTSYVSSAPFDLGDGQVLLLMDRIIPDFEFTGGDNFAELEIAVKKYPGGSEATVKGPFVVSDGTNYIAMRARGRQATLRIGVSNANSGWRAGALRFNMQADGMR